eukprot:431702_1
MIQLILSVVLTFGNSCASTSTINYDYYYFWGENTLNCNNNVDCIVNCYGNNACDSTTINGPDGAVLTINCDSLFQKHDEEEGKACSNMIIKADNSTKLYINIHNVDFEFISNKIYVPAHNNNSENNTFITCGVVGVNNNHQLAHYSCTQNNTIYSVNGWKSIQWVFTSNISLSVSNTNIMYCNQNYSDSCSVFDVDGLYYHCNDTESPCDYIRSNQTIPSISVSSKQPLFTKQSANNNFIFVKNIEMNFWLARQYCQQTFDTSLASIYNQQQNDEIFNLVNTFSNQSVWIGATDVFFQDNIWNWTETMNGLNYTNWNYTQPDYKFNEDCAIMLNINNNDKWADADCSNHLLNFVCAMPNVTYSPTSAMISLSPTVSPSKSPTFPPVQPQGYKYPFYWSHYHNFIWVDHIANWWTAALICKNDFGASFASIHSVHDNTEAYEVCRDKNCWIGGTDNYGSSWQWDDHTSFDYSNWMRNDVKQTHCIKFINGSDEWTTHLCSDASFTFLCAEFPTPSPTEVTLSPTFSSVDATHIDMESLSEYYNSSTSAESFSSQRIISNSQNVFIECNMYEACYNTTIDASSSATLRLSCTEVNSCRDITITNGPTDSIFIHCKNGTSCAYADFNVQNTNNVYIECDSTAVSGACNYALFNAQYAENVNVACGSSNDCYRTIFNVNNTNKTVINSEGYNSDGDIIGINIRSELTINCQYLACQFWDIHLPDNAITSNIYANGYQTLYGANIYCGSNTECNIYVPGDTNNAAKYANIWCPENAECNLNAGSSQSFYGANIICPIHAACNLNAKSSQSFYGANIICPIHAACNLNAESSQSFHSANIHCANNASCNLNAGSPYSFSYANIWCGNGELSCEVHAKTLQGALQNANIHCGINAPCNVDCGGNYYGCQDANIYCQSTAKCNVNCENGTDSCIKTHIHLPTDNYSNLSLSCNKPFGCDYLKFICVDTGFQSNYIFAAVNGVHGCATEECCPLEYEFNTTEKYIECSGGNNCIVNCNDYGKCLYKTYINASNATSLTIYCDEQYECQYVDVYSPYQGPVSIHCTDIHSCQYMRFYQQQIQSLSLNCASSYSCEYMRFYQQQIQSLSLNCASSYSCEYMRFYQQ